MAGFAVTLEVHDLPGDDFAGMNPETDGRA